MMELFPVTKLWNKFSMFLTKHFRKIMKYLKLPLEADRRAQKKQRFEMVNEAKQRKF